MATLAPATPITLVAPAEAFSFGTAAAAFNGSDLHGQDFKALRHFLLVERSRTAELAEQILAAGQTKVSLITLCPRSARST